MKLFRYILRRILIAIPILLGITLIDYALSCLAGSPLEMLVGPRISQDALAAKEIMMGLDRPFYIQYLIWLKQLLGGNLGYSFRSREAVGAMILENLPSTLLLMGTAFVVSLLIALPAGIYAATHRGKARDHIIVTLSMLGTAIPGFFLSLLLIYIFTVKLNVLPSSGMYTLGSQGGMGDLIRHMVMPVTVLAFGMAGTNIRYIRSALLEVLDKDYMRTARARGLGRRRVLWRHGLRNALLSIITVFGMQLPLLFGGAVIIEQVFRWPGLGLLTMNAINGRDYPVVMGVCLVSALAVVLTNLITDILYALADPTIRYR